MSTVKAGVDTLVRKTVRENQMAVQASVKDSKAIQASTQQSPLSKTLDALCPALPSLPHPIIPMPRQLRGNAH